VTTVVDQRLLFMQVSAPRKTLGKATQSSASDKDVFIPAPLGALSGGDPMLDAQIAHAAKLAPTPVSLLLLGETGCGKEFFAKAIHQSSPRRLKPFVAVNCAALPEGLIESELFGYAPGSFTGALGKGKVGLIQQADQGTLFLDEIGDMPLSVQVRLLRVFSEQEVLPVGAKQPIKVNIRLISASHRDLSLMVGEGSFREDLFYRLAGARLQLPPLRERHDLAWVIQHLFGLYAWPQGAGDKPSLGVQTLELLKQHSWPGNLRELRTVIEYACSVAQGAVIQVADLPDYLRSSLKLNMAPSHLSSFTASQGAITSPERMDLLAALKRRAWNVSLTATDLGLSRMTLYRRMKRLDIAHPKNS
jgi:transcriptional regulator of acetoin/glycerol metabolism